MSDHQHVNGHDEPVLGIEELAEIAAHDERQNFLDVAAIAAVQGMLVGKESFCATSLAGDAWEVAHELWRVREVFRCREASQ